MSTHMSRLMIELAVDPGLVSRFRRDPEEVMAGAGLTVAERAALLSGNAAEIRHALRAPVGVPTVVVDVV